MSLSHSHRVSTGLAASQEMLLRATCLQIKGALGFPKRIVLFVVLFYVQPCCRTFHTSSFWGLGLPNRVQSLQAKTPAGWKLKFGSDSDDEAISDVPMRIWISKFVSSEVGNRSPSKDGSRRAPQLLLEMECSFGWSRLRCAGVKASNVPRNVGGSWFLSCKVLHVKVVMGAPEKNLRALRLPGSGPSEFNQWFFSQGFADSWDRLSFKTLGVNIEHLFQRAKYRPNSEKFAALSGGQCLELDRQPLAPKLWYPAFAAWDRRENRPWGCQSPQLLAVHQLQGTKTETLSDFHWYIGPFAGRSLLENTDMYKYEPKIKNNTSQNICEKEFERSIFLDWILEIACLKNHLTPRGKDLWVLC